MIGGEHSYGFPSGHSQGSLVFWGILGKWIGNKKGLLLAIVLPLLISFSRLYLGVHFPTDVLGGWILGIIILSIWLFKGESIKSYLSELKLVKKVILTIIFTIFMIIININDLVLPSVFLGLTLGYIICTEKLPFKATGLWWKRVSRYFIGILGVVMIYFALKLVLPSEGEKLYSIFKVFRYSLVGFWVAYIAPLIFYKINLIEIEK